MYCVCLHGRHPIGVHVVRLRSWLAHCTVCSASSLQLVCATDPDGAGSNGKPAAPGCSHTGGHGSAVSPVFDADYNSLADVEALGSIWKRDQYVRVDTGHCNGN